MEQTNIVYFLSQISYILYICVLYKPSKSVQHFKDETDFSIRKRFLVDIV